MLKTHHHLLMISGECINPSLFTYDSKGMANVSSERIDKSIFYWYDLNILNLHICVSDYKKEEWK